MEKCECIGYPRAQEQSESHQTFKAGAVELLDVIGASDTVKG